MFSWFCTTICGIFISSAVHAVEHVNPDFKLNNNNNNNTRTLKRFLSSLVGKKNRKQRTDFQQTPEFVCLFWCSGCLLTVRPQDSIDCLQFLFLVCALEPLLAVFSVVLCYRTYTAFSSLFFSSMSVYGVCPSASSERLRLRFFSGWESFLRGDECEVLPFICPIRSSLIDNRFINKP